MVGESLKFDIKMKTCQMKAVKILVKSINALKKTQESNAFSRICEWRRSRGNRRFELFEGRSGNVWGCLGGFLARLGAVLWRLGVVLEAPFGTPRTSKSLENSTFSTFPHKNQLPFLTS